MNYISSWGYPISSISQIMRQGACQIMRLNIPAALKGPTKRDLIGILQISTDRQAAG
jgi:hypothetical protein